ncbi:hypothetical protein PanWU01x14_284570 [Parasponia andersonii]|uniref:Uncharacterized protein n=1 Tax=Parasponia andersonii TaxID=3476 RepID=A0A2P5AZS1_PARAD|nr:hypothetical protein PanWU01x14_284570 [Parasponia andersonii]
MVDSQSRSKVVRVLHYLSPNHKINRIVTHNLVISSTTITLSGSENMCNTIKFSVIASVDTEASSVQIIALRDVISLLDIRGVALDCPIVLLSSGSWSNRT